MTLVLSQRIPDFRGVTNAERYLANRYCVSHRDYDIWFPGPLCEHSVNFLDTLEWGLKIVQHETKLVRPADWVVVSFRAGSHLLDCECDIFDKTLRQALCADGFSQAAWHRHRSNGRADLNVLVPRIRMTNGVPALRRWHLRPLFSVAFEAVTSAIRAVNMRRLARDKIVEPCVARTEALLSRGVMSLPLRLARAAREIRQPVTRESLPTLLLSAGFLTDRFVIASNSLLLGGRKQRLRVDKLIDAAKALYACDPVWLHPEIFCETDDCNSQRRKRDLTPNQRNFDETQVIPLR